MVGKAMTEHERLERQIEVWMLNLRFVLIVLVFIASGIEPLTGRSSTIDTLYTWIFMFHMPLFAFVTGYFARSNLLGCKGNGLLRIIAIQYVIFQTLYTLADLAFFHASVDQPSFFLPYLMLWFLVAHFGWRCMLRLMVTLRIKHPFLLSIMLGVAVGYWSGDGSWLSVSRLFVFLPFFAAGYSIHPGKILRLYAGWQRRAMRAVSVVLLIAVPLLAWHGLADWLYGKFTYAQMGFLGIEAGAARAGCYLLQIVAGATFLAWIPRRVSICTDLGSRTLYVFLLHGIFVRSWIRLDVYSEIQNMGGTLVLLAVIMGLTFVLAMPQIRSLTHWLIEPDVKSYLSRLGWGRQSKT